MDDLGHVEIISVFASAVNWFSSCRSVTKKKKTQNFGVPILEP